MLIVIIAILFIVWVVHDFKKAGAEITNEHSIRQYLDYLVRNKGGLRAADLFRFTHLPVARKAAMRIGKCRFMTAIIRKTDNRRNRCILSNSNNLHWKRLGDTKKSRIIRVAQ